MFHTILEIENYLKELVPMTSQTKFPGEKGIARTKELLRLLGSPQNKMKVIHVAGTSGKGSTSYMISKLLCAHGFKTGLHLSPHLLDIRERALINNELLSEKKFVSYFNAIISAIEKIKRSSYRDITYFEVMVVYAFYVFAQEEVEYAIVEVGLGGKFDGTNVVDRSDKLAVVTRLGFDHTKVLGNKLSQIAYQKAMICVENGELLTIYQHPSAYSEIKKVVTTKKAHLLTVEKHSIKNITLSEKSTLFSFIWKEWECKNMRLGLIGAHQAQNASLALATVHHLSKRDGFILRIDEMRSTCKDLRFKGRFDIVTRKNSTVILDGAHNVQKMKAFLKTLHELYPQIKFTFVIAFKLGKEYKKMIRLILPYAQKLVITHIFSTNPDFQHFSVTAEEIVHEITKLGYVNVTVIKNSNEIIKMIQKNPSHYVISGSLYLLGDIYEHL